jgi:hypothetical protein
MYHQQAREYSASIYELINRCRTLNPEAKAGVNGEMGNRVSTTNN